MLKIFFCINIKGKKTIKGNNKTYRESDHGLKFKSSVENCLTGDPVSFGPGSGLIRVGQLRKVVGAFANNHRFPHKFRVDAVKDFEVKKAYSNSD
jgi:hypothetical protein